MMGPATNLVKTGKADSKTSDGNRAVSRIVITGRVCVVSDQSALSCLLG